MFSKSLKIVLGVILALGIFTSQINTADAASKVMWGKTELKLGQIGKVTVLAKTKLVKLNTNGSLTTVRTLKKGEEFRVYNFKSSQGGLFGVGGGSYIQKNSNVKYETPSKSKLALLKKIYSGVLPKTGLKLTYSPGFASDYSEEYTVIKNPDSLDSKILSSSKSNGYIYFESKDRITLAVDNSDWILFDFEYPFVEGQQTKDYSYDENWQEVYDSVKVESTSSVITVKAGTFKDVIIMRYTNGAAYFLAPGYGVIKAVNSNGKTVMELVSVK